MTGVVLKEEQTMDSPDQTDQVDQHRVEPQQAEQPMGDVTREFLAAIFNGGRIYERFRVEDAYEKLKAVAYKQAGDRAHKVDPSMAAMETLVQAALRRDQFRGTTEAEFWGWLRRILVNQVLEGLRRMEAHAAPLNVPAVAASIASREAEPAAAAQHNDQVTALYRAIEQLPEEDREIFCVYYRSDIPRPFVAAILGIKPEALRQRAHRVSARLEVLMAADGKGPGAAPRKTNL